MQGIELLEAVVRCGCGHALQCGGVEYVDPANLRFASHYSDWQNHSCSIRPTIIPNPKQFLILLQCKRCVTNLCFVPLATLPTIENPSIYGDISPQDFFVVEEHIKLCLNTPRVKEEEEHLV
mgnify:CR=1 FL=1